MWRRLLARLVGRDDPYDLARLREVHADRAWRPGDPEPVETSGAGVLCRRCGVEFDSRLGACPGCGAGA